jgi:ketosteroid isomerase-like protein
MPAQPSLIAAIVLSAIAQGPLNAAGAATIETQIRSVLDAQANAWNRGDVDGYMNGYARGNSTEFVGGDALTRGWQTVRDRYAKKYDSREKMGTLSFSELNIIPLSAEAAFVTGRWKLVRKADKPHGRFTLIFRRTADGWRIVHDHTSAALSSAVMNRRYGEESRRRARIFSWMPSNPPLLKTATMSLGCKSGTRRSIMCAASCS